MDHYIIIFLIFKNRDRHRPTYTYTYPLQLKVLITDRGT